MTPVSSPPEGLKGLIVAASLVVVVAGLKAAETIFVPFLLALFLAILCLPLLNVLRRRLPNSLAVIVTMLLTGSIFAVAGWVLSLSVERITEKAPRYQERFQRLITTIVDWLGERGVRVGEWISPESIGPGPLVDLAGSTFIGVATLLTGLFLVLLIMSFLLLEASTFKAKLETALGRGDVLARYAKITGEVQRYLVIKTLISLATGVSIGVWVWVVGLDFPLLWGFTAFLANYIPNLGSILAAVPAVLLALVQLSVPRMLLVVLGYALVNLFFGNILEPQVMGRRLRLSPLVVFLSLIFWGWVWGVIGMLLAVPITMVLKILLENTASLAWVGRLLDPPPRQSS